jgi:hypothetical protein
MELNEYLQQLGPAETLGHYLRLGQEAAVEIDGLQLSSTIFGNISIQFNQTDVSLQITISNWTLYLAFLVPIVALLIIVCIGLGVWRRRTFAYDYSYQQVNHDLDDEEIEFKNMLESHGSSGKSGNGTRTGGSRISAADTVIDENDEELNFSTSDMGRLDMLEKYRDKLVSNVNISNGGDGGHQDSDGEARI